MINQTGMMEERIDSLKSGITGAVAVGITFGFTLILHSFIFALYHESLTILPQLSLNLQDFIRGTIAGFSGFLFGVTYRYIIREDQNVHLQSGAIVAFGLVRGLGQIDVSFSLSQSWVELIILLGESLLLFAVAAVSLDWAIKKGWIKSLP
jgi:hypothetical protein